MAAAYAGGTTPEEIALAGWSMGVSDMGRWRHGTELVDAGKPPRWQLYPKLKRDLACTTRCHTARVAPGASARHVDAPGMMITPGPQSRQASVNESGSISPIAMAIRRANVSYLDCGRHAPTREVPEKTPFA